MAADGMPSCATQVRESSVGMVFSCAVKRLLVMNIFRPRLRGYLPLPFFVSHRSSDPCQNICAEDSSTFGPACPGFQEHAAVIGAVQKLAPTWSLQDVVTLVHHNYMFISDPDTYPITNAEWAGKDNAVVNGILNKIRTGADNELRRLFPSDPKVWSHDDEQELTACLKVSRTCPYSPPRPRPATSATSSPLPMLSPSPNHTLRTNSHAHIHAHHSLNHAHIHPHPPSPSCTCPSPRPRLDHISTPSPTLNLTFQIHAHCDVIVLSRAPAARDTTAALIGRRRRRLAAATAHEPQRKQTTGQRKQQRKQRKQRKQQQREQQ